MNTTEYIKMCLIKRNMSIPELAEKTNQSYQSLHQKLTRGIYKQAELEKIAAALDCHLDVKFIDNETNEPLI